MAFGQQISDPFAAARAQLGTVPIQMRTLTPYLIMLSGPGGNVLVLNSPDGKIVIDTFVKPAWPGLRTALDTIGRAPVRLVINTHWHFDSTDNNENFRRAGAQILAHQYTKLRLTEGRNTGGLNIPAAPAAALPTRTFQLEDEVESYGETIKLYYVRPAHTDTDIFVHFVDNNMMHLGDVFFSSGYPVIDSASGGSIEGMLSAVDLAMKLSPNIRTRYIGGHGPLGTLNSLERYKDMLQTVRDRVGDLQSGARTRNQVIALKPSRDFDDEFGHGIVPPDEFVRYVYDTL